MATLLLRFLDASTISHRRSHGRFSTESAVGSRTLRGMRRPSDPNGRTTMCGEPDARPSRASALERAAHQNGVSLLIKIDTSPCSLVLGPISPDRALQNPLRPAGGAFRSAGGALLGGS